MEELTATGAQQPATLELIQTKLDFHIGNWRNDTLEIGYWLTEAKKTIPHGGWVEWVENRYGMNKRMARRFIAAYDRFGKGTMSSLLNSSQMFELLTLPADETTAFIEAKAAEGTPVENMTIKTLREEVQQWKDKAERATEDNERGKTYNIAIRKDRDRIAAALHDAEQKLQKQPQVIIQPPDDYEQVKQDLAKLRNEKAALQKKLDATIRNVEVPADYHANKKKLAELDSKIAEMQKQIDDQVTAEDYGNVAHKLDTILSLINDVLNSKNAGRVMADYERNRPDRYNMILAQFETFLEVMK